MTAKQEVPGRKRRSSEEIKRLVVEFEASGLRQKSLSVKTGQPQRLGTSSAISDMRTGYARVSFDDQTLDLQRDALERAKCRQPTGNTLAARRLFGLAADPALAILINVVQPGCNRSVLN